MKQITSKIVKTAPVNWKKLKPIQGEKFKDLSAESYKKLKTSLIKNNFIAPFAVWQDKDKAIYTIDGVHRQRVLTELESEGYDVPEALPANFIECKNRKEAAKMLLVYSSAYARTTESGLAEFLDLEGLNLIDLSDEIELSDFDIKKFLKDNGLKNLGESTYSQKIEIPVYEPKNEKPKIEDLYDAGKYKKLLKDIEKSKLPEEEKEFLRLSATRHIVFNYSKIADFYAHSDKKTQGLMEDSALVIIDFDRAIELGFVRLSNEIAEIYQKEYNG